MGPLLVVICMTSATRTVVGQPRPYVAVLGSCSKSQVNNNTVFIQKTPFVRVS